MIEIRNETNKKLFVKLCKSKITGALYLHIDNKKSKHINIPVKANYYEIIDAEEVEC
jgi:hypothetical protein